MKDKMLLPFMSVLSAVLFTIHVADDIHRGLDRVSPQSYYAVAVLVLWLYAALVAAERRWAQVVMLLAGILSAGMPLVHFRGARIGEIAASDGGLFFIWMLWAIAASGGLSLVLAVRALWLGRATSAATP